ncbi:MAG TPA: ribonuclease III [Bacteroidia bacterium]|nr:ribonuclease III [Bacteroidia bacterium]
MALKRLLSLLNLKNSPGDKEFKAWVRSTSGHSPNNLKLYQQAFSHRSVSGRRPGISPSNERLEFLGDAVLGAIVADYLFRIYSSKDEGFLTQLRSRIVNGQSLRNLALKFGFERFLKTSGRGGETSVSALGDAFEAFIGALYLDQGYTKTRHFVINRIVKTHLDLEKLVRTNEDFKSQLQIYCQKNKFQLEYRLISEERLGRGKLYVIQVHINDKPYTRFEGYNKRNTEQKAAELSLQTLLSENG